MQRHRFIARISLVALTATQLQLSGLINITQTLIAPASAQTGQAQCNDGQDNDGDGKIDHPNDRGCASTDDALESGEPIAYLDGQLNPQVCSIQGWACDADNFGQPLDVHLYLDGPVGAGGQFLASVRADQSRDAGITATCGGNANHAFTFTPPVSLQDN